MNILIANAQGDMISWTVAVIAAISIVALFVLFVTTAGSYFSPRLERLQKGLKAQPGEKPCCPTGLGCNDPSKAFRNCRRERAIAAATLDELNQMEQAWSKFCSTSKRRTSKRNKYLAEYGSVRDRIIFRQLAEAPAGDSNKQLSPGSQMKAEEEEVDGEVVNPSNRPFGS